MRYLKYLLIFTPFALMAAGCGQTAAPVQPAAPVSQQQPAQPPAAAAPTTTQPAATGSAPTTAPSAASKPKTTTVTPAPRPTPTQQEINANKMAPVTAYVTIKGGAFSPQVITVKAGGTVVWTNKDAVPHTTKSDNTLLWDSGTLQPGASFSHVFKSVGSYPYSCVIHPSMHGTVMVY